MTPARPSANAWSRVKELFFALETVPRDERDRRLAELVLESDIRTELAELLAAHDAVGDRFQRSAMVAMHDELPPAWRELPTLVGRRLGRYDVIRLVGQGGMGAVYEAVRADDTFRQTVALKTLWRGADSAVLSQRLRSERQILAGLQHPNIAVLLDGGATEEGTPYLVMEFVDGVPIDEYCDSRRLGIAARLDLFRQVCAAVQHAHARLVVHRDLKPSNVLVASDGTVKLLDFGIAKLLDDPRSEGTLTGAGLSPFTATFAAPEQLTGEAIGTATDVYALGALLCVLLAGRPPIGMDGLARHEMLNAIREQPATPPSALANDDAAHARGFGDATRLARALRGELDSIVLMAMRKEPQRRYATVDALSDDVRRHLRGDRVLARPDTMAYRIRAFTRRRRVLVVGFAGALLALVAGGTVALRAAHTSRLEALRAERVAAFLQTVIGAGEAGAGGPFTRLGPRASLAQALDSAMVRVALAFPDDPRVRVRLYTAIGRSLTAQGRADASVVLDSAVTLSLASYGAESAVTGEARLAAGYAALRTNQFERATALMRAALVSARADDAGGLYARVLAGLATTQLVLGKYASAESLAKQVLAREDARTKAPTAARAWALRVIGTTRSDDSSAAYFMHAISIMDSLGATVSAERLDGLLGLAQWRLIQRRYADAESLSAEGLRLAQQSYGTDSREAAQFHGYRAEIARREGSPRVAAVEIDSAVRILRSLPNVVAAVREDILAEQLAFLLWQRRFAEAETVATQVREFGRTLDLPVAVAIGAHSLGDVRAERNDWHGAEEAYRESIDATLRVFPQATEVRRQLAIALEKQGRHAAADSQMALLKPQMSAPQTTRR